MPGLHILSSQIDNDHTMAANSPALIASQQATKALISSVAGGGGAPPTTSASDLIAGTLNDARLSGNVILLTATQTLTNKSISGATNTFSAIPQSAIISLSSDLSGKQPISSILTAISSITGANDDVIQKKGGTWVSRTIAQYKTDLSLTKTDIGLDNVDNTSDATKNSATATLTNKVISGSSNTFSSIPQSSISGLQTSLDAKASLSSPSFIGTPLAPTAAVNTNTTQIATTAFVLSNIPTAYFATAQYSGTGTTSGDPLTIANLSGSVITSGTVADGRLSSNVPLKNAANTFTAIQTFTNIVMGGGIISNNDSSSYSLYSNNGAKLHNNGPVDFSSTLELTASGSTIYMKTASGTRYAITLNTGGTAFVFTAAP